MLQDHHFTNAENELIERSLGKGISQVDVGYVATFNDNDYIKLQKFFQHIKLARQYNNLSRKNELLEYYEQFLSREYQDKSVSYEWIPEPVELGYKPDRVVFSGLERIADLVTGVGSLFFTHYAIGTGTAPVLPANTALDFEEKRVSMVETGFAESKGSSMVFAGSFPTTLPSMAVTESGIFDRQEFPGTMLLRTLYTGSNIVNHVFNQTFVNCSHFVYMLSV